MDKLLLAQLLLMGLNIADAAARGVSAAVQARKDIETMVRERRNPTPEEWDRLAAVSDELHAQIQGERS
ncbi:hypothetical protein [Telmatospirillum sp. J64-1]|uniref:hypothetical protein n=1 Tax=Telmatospirillum sp. J64-1 TaxID=2502183 RepID=UPI00115D3264|nr:hypothetical protein [Telmatospirillum sp. J64-1]